MKKLIGESFIVNPRRVKQLQEFVDDNHSVMGSYYDALEMTESDVVLKRKMKKFIHEDPDFYDPYIVLADILFSEGKNEEAVSLLKDGYERVVPKIVDKYGYYPKSMPWGWLENRHIIRIINRWAEELWEMGETDQALAIFRNLLKSNPNDNIGARYSILAIRLGLSLDYDLKFETKDMPGYLDGWKIEKWFAKNSKKFSDEFEWWFNWTETQ